jgi:hypothetical protein
VAEHPSRHSRVKFSSRGKKRKDIAKRFFDSMKRASLIEARNIANQIVQQGIRLLA